MIRYAHYRDVPRTDWRWRNFTPRELACRGDGSLLVVPDFLDRLQRLRAAFAAPMIISSGYRSPAHNAAVSDTGDSGPHTTGRAVDVLIAGEGAYHLAQLALAMGFTGLGVNQRGDRGRRFLHLDDLTVGPRPTLWSY